MSLRFASSVVIALFAVGCSSSSDAGGSAGGGSNGGGCNTVQGSCTSSADTGCVDYAGFANATDAQSACSGTWAASACSHSNVVAGCLVTSGSFCMTTWFYSGDSGVTADIVKMSCDAMKGTVVTP